MPAQLNFARGWIQRPARHLLPDGALVEALNVVPDDLGALVTRRGHSLVGTAPNGSSVHSLFTMYDESGVRRSYQGAGTVLYRDFVSLQTGLSGRQIDMVAMRGYQEQKVYTFFANNADALRVKDDGAGFTRWGINPPSKAPTLVVLGAYTKVIENFNGVNIATDFTVTTSDGASAVPGREPGFKQEGASSLQVVVNPGGTAALTRTISALDLTVFSNGELSDDERRDSIRLWVYVTVLNNLDRIEVALNFSSGTQFEDGYYTTSIFSSALTPGDNTWTEVRIKKSEFVRTGTAAGDWSSINGIRLTIVAPNPLQVGFDELRLEGGGGQDGRYRYRIAFARKATPASYAVGQVDPSNVFTDDTADAQDADASDVALSTTTNNAGHVIGASEYWGEAVYTIGTPHSGGTPVYQFAYWDGNSWEVFTPDRAPNFGATGVTALKFSFPTTNWRQGGIDNSHYWIRVRATTAPSSTPAAATTIKVYDSVISHRSNASPASLEATSRGQAISIQNIVNPAAAGIDLDAQVTHVELYRTVGDLTEENDQYLFEDDVPAGQTIYTSNARDAELLDELEIDNHRPEIFVSITEHQERIFGARENRVYVSKARRPESFPPTSVFEVSTLGDPIQRIRQYDGILYVFTLRDVYQIIGSDERSYQPRRINAPTGLGAPWGIEQGERGIYYYGRDGNAWVLRGSANADNFSDATHYRFFHGHTLHGIPGITTSITRRESIVAAWFNQRVYLSYPAADANTALNTATLMIDEQTGTWYRDSRAFQSLFYDRQGDALWGGLSDGSVVELDALTTDNGAPIAVEVISRDEDEGRPNSAKQLDNLVVDAETGTTSMAVEAVVNYDAARVALGTVTRVTRGQVSLVPALDSVEGYAIGYRVTWTGEARLYRLIPDLSVLPETVQAYSTLASDLGVPGFKVFSWLVLDVDLLEPGTLTVDLYVDRVQAHRVLHSALGRMETSRLRLPRTMAGRLLHVAFSSTAPFRLWPGTRIAWVPLGSREREQVTPLASTAV